MRSDLWQEIGFLKLRLKRFKRSTLFSLWLGCDQNVLTTGVTGLVSTIVIVVTTLDVNFMSFQNYPIQHSSRWWHEGRTIKLWRNNADMVMKTLEELSWGCETTIHEQLPQPNEVLRSYSCASLGRKRLTTAESVFFVRRSAGFRLFGTAGSPIDSLAISFFI